MELRENKQKLEIYTEKETEARELIDMLSCFEPGYEHITRYQMGRWDGKRNFYEISSVNNGWFLETSLGFFDRINKTFNLGMKKAFPKQPDPILFLKKELPKLPFKPYKHQLKLFMGLVQNYNHLGISSVGSGKSLTLFLLVKYFREQQKKILIIVPTIMLVTQIYEDFKDYGSSDEHQKDTQRIGGEFTSKDIRHSVVISTWQSAQNSDLSGFDIVICDEAHKAKANVLDSILNSNNFERKLGVTGSMPIIELDGLTLEKNFGEPIQYINARNMMDMGLATETSIQAIFLDHGQIPLKNINTYPKEVKYIRESEPRNRFIANFIKKLNGCSVALYQNTDLGTSMWEYITNAKLTPKIEKSFELQKNYLQGVFIITGKTPAKIREKIREHLKNNDGILIAQATIMSTGINIPRLKNLIFLQSNKSYTDVLQSVGRVLRLHECKKSANIIDFVDVLSGKRKKENFALRHFWFRHNYYKSEKFEIKEHEIELQKYKATNPEWFLRKL